MKKINILVDWGKAFVDPNGSFYAGTTEEQKDNAVEINKDNDMTVYVGDVHTRASSEFIVNNGLYPTHNLIEKDTYNLEELGVQPDQTVSPQLTEKIYNMVKDKTSGLIVPRHVFFQDYNGEKNPQPCFTYGEIEETFGIKKLDEQKFLEGGIEYVVNAKHMKDGAAMQATEWMGHYDGIPDQEKSVFTLLKQKYGMGNDLQFNITGVVMGICVYQTATGIGHMFPKSEINVVYDACTHLTVPALGIESEAVGNFVAEKMSQHIGIKYVSSNEYLGK